MSGACIEVKRKLITCLHPLDKPFDEICWCQW